MKTPLLATFAAIVLADQRGRSRRRNPFSRPPSQSFLVRSNFKDVTSRRPGLTVRGGDRGGAVPDSHDDSIHPGMSRADVFASDIMDEEYHVASAHQEDCEPGGNRKPTVMARLKRRVRHPKQSKAKYRRESGDGIHPDLSRADVFSSDLMDAEYHQVSSEIKKSKSDKSGKFSVLPRKPRIKKKAARQPTDGDGQRDVFCSDIMDEEYHEVSTHQEGSDNKNYSSGKRNPLSFTRGGASSDGASWSLSLTPRALATLSMATCMSLHYLAYSLARPATMTLFTSARLGFGSSKSAYPFSMTFISPMSFMLLLFYGKILERNGPSMALKKTTVGCASLLGLASVVIAKLDPLVDDSARIATLVKYFVGVLFVFRESYVQLITSQHWSFISSVLTPNQSSTWFAPISGLTSITSALAAMAVASLSNMWGLQGVLAVAAIALGVSVLFGQLAYSIAEENGFNPEDEHKRKQTSTTKLVENSKEESLVSKARDVFARVPTLWALFCEILACQGLSTMLNVCCITKVSEVIPDDKERAGWMGKFFATINVLSCVLQFGILPATSSFTEPSMLWKGMPLVMLGMTCFLAFPRISGVSGEPTLRLVATTFLVMKTMEFSVRRMLDEMVYVPLDYESRYLGKEVIGVLGYRFGKSAASLALSALTSSFGTMGLRELSYFSTGAAGLWLATAWKLSNLVPTRAEAEINYAKMKKGG